MFMKKLFLALLLCTVVSSSAFATYSRVVGLGGDHVNFIVRDHINAAVWPQLLHGYGNQAGAEVWGSDLQKVYVNYGFGEGKSVIQLALDKIADNHGYTMLPNIQGNNGMPMNALNLTYARPMGDTWLIGLALGYTGESYTTTGANPVDQSESILGVKLGASCTEMNLDLALHFETVSFTNEAGGATVSENDGSMALAVAGRWWWNYAENKASLIPNVRFMTQKDAAKMGSNSAAITNTEISLGAGHNWWPGDKIMVVTDFGFNFMSQKNEQTVGGTSGDVTVNWNSVPYWRAGMEGKIFEWLDGRFGAERMWLSQTSDDASMGEPEWWGPQTNTYLGATAHWNRLWLDMLVNPALLNNGLDFVNGVPTQLNSRLSLTYKFD